MTDQHTVELADCTMTRLPVGRAAGRLWLFFVVTGLPLSRFDPQSAESPWRLREHVAVFIDDAQVAIEEGGGSGSESLTLEYRQLRDPGMSSISLRYLSEGQVVDAETVSVPEAP
ncbi:hypothetical protein [Aeromicrobium sp. 9AM]|uniref:hypothetical protein n=1 Tax=Aeromicrobium sp. 9AM TaxID=2653126 RepID=UPI00135775E7|nr:hypothetical protein [Aeromicrobium sp. 9AM]